MSASFCSRAKRDFKYVYFVAFLCVPFLGGRKNYIIFFRTECILCVRYTERIYVRTHKFCVVVVVYAINVVVCAAAAAHDWYCSR